MKESRMQRLRKYYGVPAKRGGRILFEHTGAKGRITSADRGHRLRVLFDGETRTDVVHPTWKVVYL